MKLKFLFKALSFSLVTTFAFASETDNCKEIKEYFENKSLNYSQTIEKCNMNDKGEVIELIVRNDNLKEEDVNKILSYNTIKDLEYEVVFHLGDERDSPYSYPLLPHPGYSKFPSAISNLPELETLNFNYNNYRTIKYSPDVTLTTIENESLKLSKKLKKLTFVQIEFSKDNLKELSKLSNLEELVFNRCKFKSNDIASLESLKNLSKLSIYTRMGYQGIIPTHIEKIKSLKQLRIKNYSCKEKSYDLTGLDNLESLYLILSEACDLDLSKLNKLSELTIQGPSYVFVNGLESPMDFKLPNSLKNLSLIRLEFTSENYKEIASLPNLEELIIDCYGDSKDINIKSLECHDNLRKLVIKAFTNDSSNLENSPEFLNDLVNLTYLEITNAGLTEIPQLDNLKKLEHLDLSNNKLFKFPKALASLKNVEYIDLNSNVIYDKIPENLNQLNNLKYFNIENNKSINGKVLTNKNLEKCAYSYDYDLCIPKGYELNCIKNDIIDETDEEFDEYEENESKETLTFKTCEDSNMEESTNGKCGKDHGKCPSGQCCGKDGQCGTTEDYCSVSKNCQMGYGDCKDECEEIYEQLRKIGINTVNKVKCTSNKQGKAQSLVIHYGDESFIKQLENISDLESLTIECINEINDFKPIVHNSKLTTFIISSQCYTTEKDFPEDVLNLKELKILELPAKGITAIPKNIKNLKNLEYLDLFRNELKELPDEFGELQNLKSLILEENKFTKFPLLITKLKNLEYLDLDYNLIDDEIPESYNNLNELKTILFRDNMNLKGKVLQNEKLATCSYNYDWELPSGKYPLCRTGNEKCLSEESIEAYPLCSGSSTTDINTSTETITTTTTTDEPTTTTDIKPTIQGKCGKGIGKCFSGYCCSKYGWCGKTDDHCDISKGCQSEFGDCKTTTKDRS